MRQPKLLRRVVNALRGTGGPELGVLRRVTRRERPAARVARKDLHGLSVDATRVTQRTPDEAGRGGHMSADG